MTSDGHTRARVSLVREDGFRFRVHWGTHGAPSIVTDEPSPLGAGAGPNPSALLAAAVGNCLASSLLYCMRKAHVEATDFEADVIASTVRDQAGRLRIGDIRVCLAPTMSPEAREKMGRCLELFESFCIVTESVRHGIDVKVAVEPRVAAGPGAVSGPTPRTPCALVGGA